MKNTFEILQDWYTYQCDGDWEHGYGVKIETLDNPGWSITIDLQSTGLQNLVFEDAKELSEFDWYIINVKDCKFVAYGDPSKLDFLVSYFLDNIFAKGDLSFEYDVLIPIEGGNVNIWTEGKATMPEIGKFEVVDIEAAEYKSILTKSIDDITFSANDLQTFEIKMKIGNSAGAKLVDTFQGVRLALTAIE